MEQLESLVEEDGKCKADDYDSRDQHSRACVDRSPEPASTSAAQPGHEQHGGGDQRYAA